LTGGTSVVISFAELAPSRRCSTMIDTTTAELLAAYPDPDLDLDLDLDLEREGPTAPRMLKHRR